MVVVFIQLCTIGVFQLSCPDYVLSETVERKSKLDLTGTWGSGSGEGRAEYKFLRANEYWIALHSKLNKDQKAAGIKEGDLAFKGTLLNKILAGTFFQSFSLVDQEKCPVIRGRQFSALYFELVQGKALIGKLLLEHLSDEPNNCEIDDRRLDDFTLTRQ